MNASAPQTEIERALTEARANEIYSSQLMRRFRDTLSNVSQGLEDEGDRIYFGSTNDADQLRAIIDEVEELEWDRILASSKKKPDLYAQLRNLNTELRALRKSQKAMLAALKAAEQFMVNGVELGFIRMPDAGTPDPAHDTLPAVRAAIAAASVQS
ncbi:hypothetical protein [Mesorhizobium ciceri]|uniref:hypothetical protein n=1 Tax=Mesorhizobium TaxID=68287 RepID=UPI00047A43AF|nr:hypothetical protein [Mesorhizobium ciceri]